MHSRQAPENRNGFALPALGIGRRALPSPTSGVRPRPGSQAAAAACEGVGSHGVAGEVVLAPFCPFVVGATVSRRRATEHWTGDHVPSPPRLASQMLYV